MTFACNQFMNEHEIQFWPTKCKAKTAGKLWEKYFLSPKQIQEVKRLLKKSKVENISKRQTELPNQTKVGPNRGHGKCPTSKLPVIQDYKFSHCINKKSVFLLLAIETF